MCSQAQLLCDHHGQPGDPLQHGHGGRDAPLDQPAAETQGRRQGRRPGVSGPGSVDVVVWLLLYRNVCRHAIFVVFVVRLLVTVGVRSLPVFVM